MASSTCQENLVTNVFVHSSTPLHAWSLSCVAWSSDEIPADGSRGSGGVPVVAE